jgi:hypothetical protein
MEKHLAKGRISKYVVAVCGRILASIRGGGSKPPICSVMVAY